MRLCVYNATHLASAMEINKFISAALGLVRFFIPGFRGKGDASNINRPQYAAKGGCNEVKRSYLSETGSRCQANHRDSAGKRARQFFLLYPIASAVRTQLNWSQYKMLIAISDPEKREYYELEAVNNSWNGRELERQINSQLYERLLLSNDKESVLAVARKERIPETPQEVIKDPMVLEFLGLERNPAFYETDLEGAIISHITDFLLELGKGFAFVARQKRIMLEDDEFFIDLVLYNRLLRCFVVIEIKTGKITHQDLGQLQMYVNYHDRIEKLPDENPTIGILLCAGKNDSAVKMTLPEDNKTILASEYKLYLPTTEQLVGEINEAKELVKKSKRIKKK